MAKYGMNGQIVHICGDKSQETISISIKNHIRVSPKDVSNLYFVLGKPGSGKNKKYDCLGKGTQCEKLASEYGLFHISSGNLLRREILLKTEIGLEVLKYLEEGLLVPTVYFLC